MLSNMQYLELDLLSVHVDEGVIVHQINAIGAIGGLNLAICNRYKYNRQAITPAPEAVLELGQVVVYVAEADAAQAQAIIVNCVGQVFPGPARQPYDSYELRRAGLATAIASAHELLSQSGLMQSDYKYFVPFNLACGRGGDNWCDIAQLLTDLEAQLGISVVVCVPEWAAGRAKEYTAPRRHGSE